MKKNNIIYLTDEGILASIKENSEVAFREIFNRYWAKLYIYAFNIVKEKDICEDIVQEVFSDLWTRRKKIQITTLSPYLFRAVKLQVFKYYRQKKVNINFEEQFEIFITKYDIEHFVEYKELEKKVDDLVLQLPEQRRIIFHLSRHNKLSNKEIANQLDLSLQTVKNQISSALKFLRTSIKSILFIISYLAF